MMSQTGNLIDKFACTCKSCQAYIHLTDGDYEHDFVVAHSVELNQCIKQYSSNNPDPMQYNNFGYINIPTASSQSPTIPRGSSARSSGRYLPFEIR